MRHSRRCFLKRLTGVISMLMGATQLVGCLGESDSQPPATSQPPTEPAPAAAMPPAAQPTPPPQASSSSSGPVWVSEPTIELVEGVPSAVAVSQFVSSDSPRLVITLQSGTLLPGITWNPSNATLAYDGRPLGAKPYTPIVLTGLVFSADDRKN